MRSVLFFLFLLARARLVKLIHYDRSVMEWKVGYVYTSPLANLTAKTVMARFVSKTQNEGEGGRTSFAFVR